MTIKSVKELNKGRMQIDLTGPDGSAFALTGYARKLAKHFGSDPNLIVERMQSGDYENLVKVFDDEFGDVVNLYR